MGHFHVLISWKIYRRKLLLEDGGGGSCVTMAWLNQTIVGGLGEESWYILMVTPMKSTYEIVPFKQSVVRLYMYGAQFHAKHSTYIGGI